MLLGEGNPNPKSKLEGDERGGGKMGWKLKEDDE